MSTVERLYAPILERPSPDASTGVSDNKDDAIALHHGAARSSVFWPMQLLPARRREAMCALYAFCREVDDIAVGEASRSLKQALLLNWRSEIAHLYAGRPRHAVPLGLNKAIHLYGLRCDDFLAIIDGIEVDLRTDTRAPRLAELVASVWQSPSAGYQCASVERRRWQVSVSRQNSAGRCSSPTYFVISPKMRSDTGCTCSRAAARARHIRHNAELGAGAAGASRRLPRSGRTRRTALRGCRRGNCRLPPRDDAPGSRDARHLSRPSPRASRARLAAVRRTSTNPWLAQTGPRNWSRAGGALKPAVPMQTAPGRSRQPMSGFSGSTLNPGVRGPPHDIGGHRISLGATADRGAAISP